MLSHRWAGGAELHHAGLGRTAPLQPSCRVPVRPVQTQSLVAQEPGNPSESTKAQSGSSLLWLSLTLCSVSNRTMWEWSLSSKGRRGEVSTAVFLPPVLSVQTSTSARLWPLTCLLLCRILQFPRPIKLEDLRSKAKVAFGQTMGLHYTNNEVRNLKCNFPLLPVVNGLVLI